MRVLTHADFACKRMAGRFACRSALPMPMVHARGRKRGVTGVGT